MKFKVRGIDTFASTGGRPFDKNKPLIIFVHGSGLSHMVWVLQTRYFAFRGYSVLALDLPGHGLSSCESLKTIEEMGNWVGDVIGAVGCKEASLVGHSQGCLVTMECAAQHPEKIKTLTLMGGASATHSQMDEATLKFAGLSHDMIRLSVGLEDFEDIVNDFEDGFRAAKKPRLVANK